MARTNQTVAPNESSHETSNEHNKDVVEDRQHVGRIDQVWNREKYRWEFLPTAPRGKKQEFAEYVILVRRVFDPNDNFMKRDIEIKGSQLQKALLDLNANGYPINFDKPPPKIDPEILFHSLDGLRNLFDAEKEKDSPNSNLLFELEAALDFIPEEFADTLQAFNSLGAKNEITFELLWTIFPPQLTVCGIDVLGDVAAYSVVSTATETDTFGVTRFIMTVTNVNFDGKTIGRVQCPDSLKIGEFAGARKISSLKWMPIDNHPQAGALRSNLLERGKTALKLYKRQVVEYKEGHALKPGFRGILVKFNPHGRVVLDPEGLKLTKPENNMVTDVSREIKEEALTENDIITLSSTVVGFSLGDKVWGKFSVSRVKDVEWNDDVFKSLVIDEEYRDFIHDLVQSHQSNNAKAFDDIVRDKGRGLVGLLSGSPGVGKTLTAEAIAEVTKRPLYMISSGELGEVPSEIHAKLTEILELAELWDAVLLLDEADVFLVERDDSNLTRNAIASIFLRELEYYRGILILTTNRLTSFDQAFQSRIHFCIAYPDLDGNTRQHVWRTFVDRAIANSGCEVGIGEEDIRDLAKLELNGRQIKNVMSISQAVALKRGERLDVRGVRVAMRLSQSSWEP